MSKSVLIFGCVGGAVAMLLLVIATGPREGASSISSATPVTSTSSESKSCSPPWRPYYSEKYKYGFCFPGDWTVDAGQPPDASRIAVGPQEHFRPLIVISAFDASKINEVKELLL